MKEFPTRRDVLFGGAAAAAACAAPSIVGALEPLPQARMGFTMASYAIRSRAARSGKVPEAADFANPLNVIEHCHRLGGGGVQMGVGGWDAATARKLSERCAKLDMYLEGQIGLPKKQGEVERFDRQLAAAKAAGVKIVRTVTLGGRRYETFKTADDWRDFRRRAVQSLAWAEPVAKKHGIRIALENHKDWRIEEMIPLIRKIDSSHVRVCLDTGNNISLLDGPMETVRELAPYAITTHLKDMAVQPCAEGFLLSEVPLGQGLMDLPEVVRLCRAANPNIAFNLEMITRDPLTVPCLTETYWATFGDLPARELVQALRRVRANPPKAPVVGTSGLSTRQQIELEHRHVTLSFAHARKHLGI